MTQIDFYLLQDVDQDARLRFACRIAHRAFSQGNRVYLHTESEADAKELDALLWQYPPHAFLPHGILGSRAAQHAPLAIGFHDDPGEHDDVLVSLCDQIQSLERVFARFRRVADIVLQGEHARRLGRERWSFYQQRGYPLSHHDIDDWED